jgi:RHS repeat-associated protein
MPPKAIWRPAKAKEYPALGVCVYCGATEGLEDEHTGTRATCVIKAMPCFKVLSRIGKMTAFGRRVTGAFAHLAAVAASRLRAGSVPLWSCALVAGLSWLAPASAQTTVRYLHTDALGSVVAKTDANGNVIERMTYEPYGDVVGEDLTDGPGYTGHVSDAATGLSYMQQRYMDPQLGMFLSVDPVTAYQMPVDQFNRYRYANGNPYKFTDPDGRAVTCDERRCSGEVNTIADALALPVILTVAYGGRLLSNAIDTVHRNETSDPSDPAAGPGNTKAPALPTVWSVIRAALWQERTRMVRGIQPVI